MQRGAAQSRQAVISDWSKMKRGGGLNRSCDGLDYEMHSRLRRILSKEGTGHPLAVRTRLPRVGHAGCASRSFIASDQRTTSFIGSEGASVLPAQSQERRAKKRAASGWVTWRVSFRLNAQLSCRKNRICHIASDIAL